MVPLGVFGSRQFSGANAVTFAVYGALGGALFLLPIQLQEVLGFSPLAAGVSLLPITVIMLALSARSGALAARIGPRLQMSVGPLLVAAGLALMARIGTGGSYVAEVLPAVVVLGFGLAVTVAPLTAAVLAAAPTAHSGVASAVNNDVARVAALITVAVLPSIVGLTGESYLHPDVFSTGFHEAVLIAAAACVIGALIAVADDSQPHQGTDRGTARALPVRSRCPHVGRRPRRGRRPARASLRSWRRHGIMTAAPARRRGRDDQGMARHAIRRQAGVRRPARVTSRRISRPAGSRITSSARPSTGRSTNGSTSCATC